MTTAFPGDVCPEDGIWTPSNNPNFYPSEYFEKVMNRRFNAGEIMPRTPHGEPSWILQNLNSTPILNFSGLTPDEINDFINKPKTD